MLHGAVRSLLPTSNQHHTTSLNSEVLDGTAAEALSLLGLFRQRQIPDCRGHKKLHKLKNISASLFQSGLKFSQWMMKVPVVCNVTLHGLTYLHTNVHYAIY